MQVVANFDFQPSPFANTAGEILISPVGRPGESFVNITDVLEGASDDSPPSLAAVKVQKVYRSYRTRRRLADSVVVAEELWWQAMDYARLNHSTISFFDYSRPETAVSRWNRVSLNASKVGKGLSIVDKAQKLAFQHWIEAIDPRHRYGHNLHVYYEEWCKADAGQPFFYWLDVGDGKDLDLIDCSRSKLKQQCIRYLGPQEREEYEYVIIDGKIVHKLTGSFLHTMHGSEGTKWIFVMSTFKQLYAGLKKKGRFHHSSFLAGGATLAAGRVVVDNGVLKTISAYSGHYRPSDDSLETFLSFLRENEVSLDDVEVHKASEDSDNYDDYIKPNGDETKSFKKENATSCNAETEMDKNGNGTHEEAEGRSYQRSLSGGLESPKADVPQKAMLQRINSKKQSKSLQLGHQLMLKWSTGAGPRIGCAADYPVQLRTQALEFVKLSPRYRTSTLSPTGRPDL
ncbi:IQ calmodulin-binding motif family protein [Raphanus sativus]|uniref:IQ domain-containing protein IQM3 n=1 Tax=Raphanus sativus TaxID=3726 RepID=A0A6J0N1R6_RAPSA|nr:IQ domain-containing protein IQM3 [Raphanus sativus]KAJ4904624.1 IQ calmodulin-binding motif family protein [Raphanus sativus]